MWINNVPSRKTNKKLSSMIKKLYYGVQTFVLISAIYLLSQLSKQSKFQTLPNENNRKNALVHTNWKRLQRNKQDTNVNKWVYIFMVSSPCIHPNWLWCWALKQLGFHRVVEICQYFVSKHHKSSNCINWSKFSFRALGQAS